MMRTDDLIRALAADLRPARPLGRRLALAGAAGLGFSALLAVLWLGVRPDLPAGMLRPEVGLKFVAMGALAGAALAALDRLARPGHAVATAASLALAALAAAGLAALAASGAPAGQAGPLVAGAVGCAARIGALSLAPFAALSLAMRAGAPLRPALAGAAAGAAAGALAATGYALYCPIDAGAVAAAWYGLAVAVVAALGAVLGRRLYAW